MFDNINDSDFVLGIDYKKTFITLRGRSLFIIGGVGGWAILGDHEKNSTPNGLGVKILFMNP